jgi:putative SOS response-associated peptidase YedK
MCGRYTLITTSNLYKRYDVENTGNSPNLEADYNVFPGKVMPVITHRSPNAVEMMKWGLIPYWAKDPNVGSKMINARDDSLLKRNTFKVPFKSQRCLVPASGFYEWRNIADRKIPYYISVRDEEVFSFAGLYDTWKDAEGHETKTFTIITTKANELISPIHHRMPVILAKANEGVWLSKVSFESELLGLLKSFDEDKMNAFTVSPDVNNPANNFASLIEPRSL